MEKTLGIGSLRIRGFVPWVQIQTLIAISVYVCLLLRSLCLVHCFCAWHAPMQALLTRCQLTVTNTASSRSHPLASCYENAWLTPSHQVCEMSLSVFGLAILQTQCANTAGYPSFGPAAQCVVHAREGLACRTSVTPASSPVSHCKQCSALTPPSLHARGCASPSRAR
jgi:hypothetical protein